MVIVEQPTDEAYAPRRGSRQLLVAIGLALLGTIDIGWFWGRSFITRIFALTRATRGREGRLDERVAIGGTDEIRQLGDAFNSMADRLVELQDDVRQQERQAMFGKIAAGLVHDLAPDPEHRQQLQADRPMFDDRVPRDTFKRMIDREISVIKRVLEDLRNIARPIPLERFPVDVNRSSPTSSRRDAARSPRTRASRSRRARLRRRARRRRPLRARPRLPQPDHQRHSGDGARRRLVAIAAVDGERVRISVSTPAAASRRRTRRHLRRLRHDQAARPRASAWRSRRRSSSSSAARSRVASEVGKGTTFTLEFPRMTQRAAHVRPERRANAVRHSSRQKALDMRRPGGFELRDRGTATTFSMAASS